MFPPKDTTQGSGERSTLWARARMDGKNTRMTWRSDSQNETIMVDKKNQTVCTLKTIVLCCCNHQQVWTPEHNLWRSSGAEPPGSCQSSLSPSAPSPPHAGFGLRLWNGGCKVPADLSPGTRVHVGLTHYSDLQTTVQLMHRNHLRLTLCSSTSFTDSIA